MEYHQYKAFVVLALVLFTEVAIATNVVHVNKNNTANVNDHIFMGTNHVNPGSSPGFDVLQFSPARLDGLEQTSTAEISFNASVFNISETFHLRVYSLDPEIAEVVEPSHFVISFKGDGQQDIVPYPGLGGGGGGSSSNSSVITVRGVFLGRTYLQFLVARGGGEGDGGVNVDGGSLSWEVAPQTYYVSVVRPDWIMDKVFIACVSLIVIFAKIGMGCKLDVDVVREVLRRPLAPAIGFCCQFIIMPTVAFSVAWLLGLEGGLALGFFMTGCAPGGGSSNMFTYLLGGDVSLSVTMTLISVLASLAMIPLWLYTLGQYFISEDMNLQIPFTNIILSLISFIIPLSVGVVIQMKRPLWAKVIRRCLKPFFIFLIVFMFTAGLYINSYIFRLFTPILILGGCLLPYSAFLLSSLVAFLFRQPANRILTIAIETGIQNTGVTVLLMKYSLPQPDADMSLAAPVVVAMFTPLPLWLMVAAREIRRRCCKTQFKEVDQKDPADHVTSVPLNSVTDDKDGASDMVHKMESSSVQMCTTNDKSKPI